MRARRVVAAFAPLLIAAAPMAGQQKPAAPTSSPARLAAVAAPAPVLGVTPTLQLEVTGGVGFTVVNMDSWGGALLNNFSKMAYWASARLLIPTGTGLRLGVEAGYHYFFWWNDYVGPPSYIYQYTVTATHLAGLVRLPVAPRITLDLGGGMHFFNNAGTHAGALAALNLNLPAGKVTIPIGVRADAIFTNPMLLPVVLNAGVRFSL